LSPNSDIINKVYSADLAQIQTANLNQATKVCFTVKIKVLIISLLEQNFTAQQIVGDCRLTYFKGVYAKRMDISIHLAGLKDRRQILQEPTF